jgi:hypothetical protein
MYPLVPRDEAGFRFQVTAANGDDEVDLLCEVLAEVDERFRLLHRGARRPLLEDRTAQADRGGGSDGIRRAGGPIAYPREPHARP